MVVCEGEGIIFLFEACSFHCVVALSVRDLKVMSLVLERCVCVCVSKKDER